MKYINLPRGYGCTTLLTKEAMTRGATLICWNPEYIRKFILPPLLDNYPYLAKYKLNLCSFSDFSKGLLNEEAQSVIIDDYQGFLRTIVGNRSILCIGCTME